MKRHRRRRKQADLPVAEGRHECSELRREMLTRLTRLGRLRRLTRLRRLGERSGAAVGAAERCSNLPQRLDVCLLDCVDELTSNWEVPSGPELKPV